MYKLKMESILDRMISQKAGIKNDLERPLRWVNTRDFRVKFRIPMHSNINIQVGIEEKGEHCEKANASL